MSSIERLPYRLGGMSMTGESPESYAMTLEIVDMESITYLTNSYPKGIPIDLAGFIHRHCVCTYCGSKISCDLEGCNCGAAKNDGLHLQVSYSTTIHNTIFREVINKENARIHSAKRAEILKTNGGTYSDSEITTLYEIQKRMCYYCGKSILSKNQKPNFHIDHFLPVSRGGRNDITNLVLTCPACNMKKGTMHGDDFERIAQKERSPDIGRQLGVIRRSLRKYLKQYELNLLGK